VKRVLVVESMGRAIYELERLDGRAVRSDPDDHRSLDAVDLLALTAGSG
jgi:hypothetical protein